MFEQVFMYMQAVETFLMGVLALHGVAMAVVALTPTPRDDVVVGKVYKVVEVLAGVLGKAKQMPPNKR